MFIPSTQRFPHKVLFIFFNLQVYISLIFWLCLSYLSIVSWVGCLSSKEWMYKSWQISFLKLFSLLNKDKTSHIFKLASLCSFIWLKTNKLLLRCISQFISTWNVFGVFIFKAWDNCASKCYHKCYRKNLNISWWIQNLLVFPDV